jgi:superfamily I DNA and/or RNA helicase
LSAAHNYQDNLLRQVLPAGPKIGGVDKFQGQEAAVVIVSMTTSKGAARHGLSLQPKPLNVAISRV